MQDIAKKYPDGLPQLDPVTDMGIQDAGVLSAIQQMNELEQQLAKNPGERTDTDLTKQHRAVAYFMIPRPARKEGAPLLGKASWWGSHASAE